MAVGNLGPVGKPSPALRYVDWWRFGLGILGAQFGFSSLFDALSLGNALNRSLLAAVFFVPHSHGLAQILPLCS